MNRIRFTNFSILVLFFAFEFACIMGPVFFLLNFLISNTPITMSTPMLVFQLFVFVFNVFYILQFLAEIVLDNKEFLTEKLTKKLFLKIHLLFPWYRLAGNSKEERRQYLKERMDLK